METNSYTNELITKEIVRLYLQGETVRSIASMFGDEADKELIETVVAETKREVKLRRVFRKSRI